MVDGTVVRIIDRGVVVDLGDDVEGFVPQSQLALGDDQKPEDAVKEGEVMNLRVSKVDTQNQRILLALRDSAVTDVEDDLDEPAESYQDRYSGAGTAAIGDHIGEELRARASEEEAAGEPEGDENEEEAEEEGEARE
jgi:small subunit ribosomal protein S1